MNREPLCILVGPTASGKSRVAVPLARRLEAEIVSLDSMLLYRGMDIGTDKPRDQGGVRHHGIDCLDPQERFDLHRYLALAEEAIEGIRSRDRRVLVVGGTGLYLMGLLKGVFEGAARDPDLRERLAEEEPEALHARLAARDPVTAARLHPRDRRRVTRALEVLETTGRPLSEFQTQFNGPDRHPSRVAGLALPRERIRERVQSRIDAMFEAGLVEEVRSLDLGPTAAQAVGYKEVVALLAGDIDEAEARRLIERNTLRLARRQATWFKRFSVHWFDAERPDLEEALDRFYRGETIE